MEYTQFGEKIIKRENAGHEWEECADDDVDARVAMGIKQYRKEERQRNGPPRIGLVMTRGPRNIAIGEKLGLGTGEAAGDALAEGLNNSKDTPTTRVPDEEFDADMAELGLSPEEARARLKGTHPKE